MNKKLRQPVHLGSGKISAPTPTGGDQNTANVVFGFQHIVGGYTLHGCDAKDAPAFIDALRLRSSLTWAQVAQLARQKLGWEKISTALKVKVPDSIPKDRHDDMLSFRFGADMQRFIGYRNGATFEIVWIDHAGDCYRRGEVHRQRAPIAQKLLPLGPARPFPTPVGLRDESWGNAPE